MKEIIDYLNSLEIVQESTEYLEDLPSEVYDKYFRNSFLFDREILIEKFTCCETSIDVWHTEEGIIGVRYVSKMYNESSEMIDIYHTLEFFEMEEFTKVSYRVKS